MGHSTFLAPTEALRRRRALCPQPHDRLGNPLKETSPDRGVLSYTHDEGGNTKTVTDARNITTGYSYDGLNRVTALDYPGTDEDVTLAFDSYTGCTNGIGKLCRVQDQSGTTEYAYDGHGTVSQTGHLGSGHLGIWVRGIWGQGI